MDRRYQHPQVTALWSQEWTHDAWWRIEQATIRTQREHGLIDKDQTDALVHTQPQPVFDGNSTRRIREFELDSGHDVVAFLRYVREWWGEPHGRWIHFGLTSSDLVDTAQALRFKALLPTLDATLEELRAALSFWLQNSEAVVGRTHGQPAEPISMGMRAAHWDALIHPASARLMQDTTYMRTMKLSGPVGNFAHNPPRIEEGVAGILHLVPQGAGSSQIVPRGNLARWATSAASLVHACAKVAMDIRLMLLLGEGREERPAGQVGSSSMAHKQNPIRAEQITGMQRLAAGYASMLQPVDLWMERDISNSSVERVAVPDLWHILFHVAEQTTILLRRFHVEPQAELNRHIQALNVHRATLGHIREGNTAEKARMLALNMPHPLAMSEIEWRRLLDTDWFQRNWPYPKETS